MGRFGCPSQLTSDRGKEFVNSVIANLIIMIDTDEIKTMAYSHEENGLLERSNRETLRRLAHLLYDAKSNENWPDDTPFVQRIHNATIHSSTGVSPAELRFGPSINLDKGIFLPLDKSAVTLEVSVGLTEEESRLGLPAVRKPMSNANKIELKRNKNLELAWIGRMKIRQQDLLDRAKSYQEKLNSLHLSQRTPEEITVFPVNSMVLITYPKKFDGNDSRPHKLHHRHAGPYLVRESVDEDSDSDEVWKDVLIDNIPLRVVNEHLDTTDITQHKIGPVNRNSRPSH
jgi:hypothetical protein